jgi:FkbM family methyltransferase
MSDIYPTLAALLKHARPGELFVDVGAHHGLFSIAFEEAGMIAIAVEPFPGNVQVFHERTMDLGIPCIVAAMSDKDGRSLLYNGGPSTAHSLVPGIAKELFPLLQTEIVPDPIEVRTMRWATLCKEFSLTEVDILKLDAKWNNLSVLTSLFETGPIPRVICTEIRKEDREQIFELCRNCRFIETIGLDGDRGIYDAIFVRDE